MDLADAFNAPLGGKPGEDNLWSPAPSAVESASNNADGNNGFETEVYNPEAVRVEHGDLVLSAHYQKDIAPATGDGTGHGPQNRVQRTMCPAW